MPTTYTVAPLDLQPGDVANLPTKRAGQDHFETRFVTVTSWPRRGMTGNVSVVVKGVFCGDKMRATMAPTDRIAIVR